MSKRRNNRRPNKNQGPINNQKPVQSQQAPEKGGASETSESNSSDMEKNKGINDPAWYAREPQMVLTSANLPFSDPLGAPFKIIKAGSNIAPNMSVANDLITQSVPGHMAFRLKHTIGLSESLFDPANVAANAFYTHVRVVNSGRKNYDPADLMLYAMSIGELYSAIEWLKRLYGYAFLYSQRNQFIGRTLLEANGVNPDSIVRNLANFNTFINTLISKVSMYAIPSTLNYFRRRVFTYSSLYLENGDANIKDQTYQFVPDGFFRFEVDTEGDGKGFLNWIAWEYQPGNTANVNQLMDYVLSLLNNIWGDEDFAIMSGDVIKAYGADLLGLSLIPSDYLVVPMYDPDVLYQMQNCDPVSRNYIGTYIDIDGTERKYGNVYQSNNGILLCREACTAADIFHKVDMLRDRYINSAKPMPDALDVMESTRLCVASDIDYSESDNIPIITGVDYVVLIAECQTYRNEDLATIEYSWISRNCKVLNAKDQLDGSALRVWSSFKYGPRAVSASVTDGVVKTIRPVSDLENYCIFDREQLRRMHEVALLSLFWVPGIARLINFAGSDK